MVIKIYRPAIESYSLSFPAGWNFLHSLIEGLVDKGESPETAEIRELKEETGYKGSIVDVPMLSQ